MNTNLGMYIEQLVDRTILYYQFNNLGFLEKRQIPIKVLKHINETTIVAKLIAKAKVDYFGYINNKYCEIECKQTIQDYFDLNLIKNHQLQYLKKVSDNSCLSYVFIYFERYNSIFAISCANLLLARKIAKKNSIPFEIVSKYGIKLEVIYPGILDLSKLF